ncbi:MAG: AIM24 family protein, partial [Deltaproteobacteria bacterium]
FLLKAVGQGPLFFNAYGGIHKIDLAQYGGGYIVDTAHVVGWQGTMDYRVRSVGGLKSLFLSGEGLVCEFSGTGSLWISTRNPGSLASFLNPFRPVQRRAQSGGGD